MTQAKESGRDSQGDLFGFEPPASKPAKAPKPPPRALKFTAYATVAVGEPVDSLYTYGIPEPLLEAVQPGSLVSVPFAGRTVRGCVMSRDVHAPTGVQPARIKPVHGIVSPGYRVSEELLALAKWLAQQTLSPPGDCAGCVSFIGFLDIQESTERIARITPDGRERLADGGPGITARQREILHFLAGTEDGMAPISIIRDATGVTPGVLTRLRDKGWLAEESVTRHRHDDYASSHPPDTAPVLTEEQHKAVTAVNAAVRGRKFRPFLLHGITGSGKTEVYLRAIAEGLESGGQAIACVPEISLTPQTVERFRQRFGDCVGVYHSRMTAGQKFDLWRRIESGECRVLVGARSAVFAPFRDIRVIVMDEEHETSYKQDSSPRYHARTVALHRARLHHAVVILGSATPSVESYDSAQRGLYQLLSLPARIDSRPLPVVDMIDMSIEARESSQAGIFSRSLESALRDTIARGEQAIVFLNRRGYFSFYVCLECKSVVRCEHCDIALTLHKPLNKLLCHYCNRSIPVPRECPACQSTELSAIGLGTQRVEDDLRQLFPEARILRMDLDTMRHRSAFTDSWDDVRRGNFDILVGTQMIAKGLHLEGVTLVGVPLADVALFQPDFRAAERAFSIMTQVAGRAGRGDRPGRVIIQTYVPRHYALQFAREHDYPAFFAKERQVRRILRFPPEYRLATVLALADEKQDGWDRMKRFCDILRHGSRRHGPQVTILGPAPAPIGRIDDRFRFRVLLRAKDEELLRRIVVAAMSKFREEAGASRLTLIPDLDPQDLL